MRALDSAAERSRSSFVAGNALLNYWKDDPHTQVILLYLESFGDAEAFTKIAREITKTKPIIAVNRSKSPFVAGRSSFSFISSLLCIPASSFVQGRKSYLVYG